MRQALLFDVETTGLDFRSNQIIEFGYLLLNLESTKMEIIEENNYLIKYDKPLPEEIVEITNITDEMLKEGIEEEELAEKLKHIISKDTILMAYNAQFDVNFLRELLRKNDIEYLNNDILDVMVVYKELYKYPHRLTDAITELGLEKDVVNSHRALDDAKATLAVLEKLVEEYKITKEETHRPSWYMNKISHHYKYPPKVEDKIPNIAYRKFKYTDKFATLEDHRRKNSFK